ncbi:polysaccharide biosynthesis protein [Nocardioides zeae]|uniref:Polysaccharide biosynthesis protein n=1 Tax=Nocardioides imazamoxiresistens TaxID=3231893 RepID=A0ABU3PZ66_9ACTN|nr:polysaccharide biosynthesis protein [Nocardioides zeae]MDT9594553.1 polysaccharide biosynthesis protein [Nocardioides zeae]
MSGTRGTLRELLRSGAGVAVAMAVMNVGTYAFTLVAARVLGPREYSAVAALMGLLLVINVLSLGLQATGARQVASDPGRRDEIENRIIVTTRRSAWALGAVCLVLSPVATVALQLDSWLPAALVAVTAVPLTIMGGQAGIFQGEKSWTPLAGIYLAVGVGRLGLGAVGLAISPDAVGAMAGVLVGAVLPTLVGGTALRRRRGSRPATAEVRSVLSEVGHNSHALLAFFALTNADVVLARAALDSHDAGLYAGGLILAKAVLFLPQFVVVIVFPSMADGAHGMYLKGLALVGGLGALATGGAWAVGELIVFGPPGEERSLVVEFVGGAAYAEIGGTLWLFALLGTVLAMMQVMVYEVVARQNRLGVYAVWAGLVGMVAAVALAHSTQALVVWVLAVDAVVLVALLVVARRSTPGASRRSGAGEGTELADDAARGA